MIKFSIGQSAPRIEDQRLVTGRGRYTSDKVDPAAARAYILRSRVAHAEFNISSTEAAESAPGVIAVYTEANLEADGIGGIPCLTEIKNRDGSTQASTDWPALARGRVRFVGQPVAMVIADTLQHASEAAELIEVDYQELPVSMDTEATTFDDAAQLWPDLPNNIAFDWHTGDEAATNAAFENASNVTSLRLENNRVVVNSMEPRPVYAEYDKDTDRSALYSSTQGPSFIHGQLAGVLNISPDKLRCVTGDVGGGFGMKVFMYTEHVLVTWASRKLGINISYEPTRSDAFVSDVHGRDLVTYAEAATDANGVIEAVRVKTYSNMGAYLSNFGPYIQTESGGNMIPGCYRIPAVYNRVIGVMTNTVPVDAYRGAGRPEATYLIERLMDVIADDHNLPPDEIRRRNFIPADDMPFTTALGFTYDSGDFNAVMERAMAQSDWAGFEQRKDKAAQAGKIRGIGMAVYIERCGGGGDMPVRIEFNDDDTLTLLAAGQNNGQGHETAYTQILSDRLGIPIDKIQVIQGDTDRTPPGFTGGSRSVPVGGSTTLVAADQVIEKGRKIASHLMEAAAADIAFENGTFAVKGTDITMDLFAVAREARNQSSLPDDVEAGLDTQANYTADDATFPNGCHICELEIDPNTGTLEIIQYHVVDDFGNLVNPKLLEGQVHGGIAQGLGQALFEHTVYDDNGQLLTGSFMDYTMPRADIVPHVHFSTLNTPCKNNLLGIKGAGEAGAIGSPPAAINAVVNALQSHTGINHIDMPATASKIWGLLNKNR